MALTYVVTDLVGRIMRITVGLQCCKSHKKETVPKLRGTEYGCDLVPDYTERSPKETKETIFILSVPCIRYS